LAVAPTRESDRQEVFLELTRSICPVCKRVIDAEVNARDNRVIMRKRCPVHGEFEALVYSDADLYMAQQRYNKPGTIPLEFQTEVKDGCPLDCGMCPGGVATFTASAIRTHAAAASLVHPPEVPSHHTGW
jgi:7,8-dihydro-6-hydroxymethylpterin dimethyltransferase